MNGADPIGRRQVFALITGDCDQGQFAEDVIERHGMREVETTVESRNGASNKVPDQRAVQKIDVKMQNVELFRSAPHFFKHNYVIRQRLQKDRIEPKSHIAATHQLSCCFGIAAGEQGNVVALAYQLFSQVRNHSLGAAVVLGWHALVEWSDLGNFHRRELHRTSTRSADRHPAKAPKPVETRFLYSKEFPLSRICTQKSVQNRLG